MGGGYKIQNKKPHPGKHLESNERMSMFNTAENVRTENYCYSWF